MFVVSWIALLTLQTTLLGSNADIIISEDGTSKWIYHEKSKQKFSIGNSIPDALFGYSIAYQANINSLIVGSPHESQIGKVYKCPMEDKRTKCDALISPVGLKDPHNLWLGATVNAGPSFLMACAPRTVNTLIESGNVLWVFGSCYYQSDMRQNNLMAMASIQTEDDVRSNYHHKVYNAPDYNHTLSAEILSDTFGWSSYVTDEGNIFVGGPAMSVGRTMVYSSGTTSQPQLITVDNEKLGDKRVSLNFGYSITAGHFKYGDELMLAISSPYGTIGYGGVYFCSKTQSDYELNDDVVLEGLQVGSLFGAALCSFDRGNGLSALLVGAPAYAPNTTKSYDFGVVYVYIFTDDISVEGSFAANQIRKLFGHNKGGYFGAAIVSVGDFDGDGIDEIAIGAPYEHDGRGAVYIYSGEQLLKLEHPEFEQLYLQRILPQDSPLNQYFGWSLSAPSDSDNNGCKELAIGAPGGNHVTLLRCMASVNVSFDVKFPDLKEQIKTLSAGDASYNFTTCLNVTYPEKLKSLTLETVIDFEVKNMHENVKISGADSNGVITFKIALANKSEPMNGCRSIEVQLPKDADYDKNITFKTTARLQQNQDPLQSTSFNPRLVLLNGRTSLSENHTITPKIPGSQLSFKMHSSLKDGYILGSTINETLTFSILNSASTAHGACVRANISGVSIAGLPPHICSYSGDKLECKNKKLLTKGESWNVTVVMNTKQMTSANEKIDIRADLRTSNCGTPTGNNMTRVLELITDNNLNVTGYVTEVKVTQEELQSVRGKSFDHIYTVINFGLTTWSNLRCEVSLPPGDLKSAVYVVYDNSTSKNCAVNDANHTATCKIKELKQNSTIHIRVQMDIGPNDTITAQILKGETTSINTSVTLALKKGDIRKKKLSNKIMITESPRVPLWIFIVAGVVGLMIVVLICWALHECGFLRRDTKKKLEELKENVKRQSMRRSAMLRLSRIEMPKTQNNQSDLLGQVELPEEESGSPDALASQDPARAAFEAELARALCKDKNTRTGARH